MSTVVTIKINADGTAAVQSLKQVSDAGKQVGKDLEQGGRQGAVGIRSASDEAQAAAKRVGSLSDMVKGLAASFLSIQGARALAGMADTWSDLTSRVRLSIGAQEDAADVMDRLADIAQQTYSNFELTAETYVRNAVTLNALGKSTQQQLDYTQALNNALVVSGAKGQQAEMVQNSLAKAMAEGTLRGEEFNNVLNYGSRVSQMLAEELGVNVTQLRGLAAEGKITGQVIFDSLVKNMQAVSEEAESMPTTIGDGFVLIRNAVLQYVGVMDQAAGMSEGLGSSLKTIAENIGVVMNVVAAAAMVMTSRYVAGLIAARIASAELAATEARKIEQDILSTRTTLDLARATVVKVQAKQADLVATQQVLAIARAEEVAKLKAIHAEIAQTQAAIAAAKAAGAQSFALKVLAESEALLTVQQARRAVITTELAALGAKDAGIKAAQKVATDALAAANANLAVAEGASNAALAAKTTMLGRVRASLLALVGGPIGATILGITGIGYAIYSAVSAERDRQAEFDKGMEESAKRAMDLASRVRELADEVEALGAIPVGEQADTVETYAEALTHIIVKTAELEGIDAELAAATAELARAQAFAANGMDTFGTATAIAAEKVSRLTKERAAASTALDKIAAEAKRLGLNMAQLEPVLESVAEVLDRMANASGLRDIPTIFAEIASSWGLMGRTTADEAAGRGLAAFRTQVGEAEKALNSAKEKTAQYRAEQQALIVTNAIASGATASQVAAIREELAAGERVIAQAAALSTARSAQTKAENELKRSREEAKRAGEQFVLTERSLLDQAAALTAELAGPAAVAQHEYEMAIRDVRERMAELIKAQTTSTDATLDATAATQAQTIVEEALARIRDQNIADEEKKAAILAKERDIIGRLNREHAEQAKTLGMTSRQLAIHEAVTRAVASATDELGNLLPGVNATLGQIEKTAAKSAAANYDLGESFGKVAELMGEFGDDAFANPIFKMVDGIALMRAEIERLQNQPIIDTEALAEAQRALERMEDHVQIQMVGSFQALLGAAKAFSSEGSKGFKAAEAGMAALSIVQDALALRAAVTAVLTQGGGDPYSAPVRMAAMAAAVAPFLASIGQTLASFGGGGSFTDTAAQRQATQGTGSVLGDSEAKSESILRATEITADATQTLVGLNRGMLRALQQLNAGIGSASGMLARGAGQAEFAPLPAAGSLFTVSGALGLPNLMNTLLGGSSRITDQGIRIGAGGLSNIDLSAYQEVQSRRWRFGSRRTNTDYQDVSDEFENQFQLIVDSIVDTVREGALALGLVPEEIEAALESFRLAEINISLMDLSAEEQQAELQAVFSQIFDNLAGHVVPFVEQFQRVGEGLGETLVRVATSVQVTQEAMRYLGLAIDETDPEAFAQIAVGLVDLSGGIEEFAAQMLTFVERFAPESHRLEVAQNALISAFDQYGLTLPETRDGMWELMQSLDATTEQGREQIAMLLQLGGVADEYYRILERGASATRDAATEYAMFVDSFTAAGQFRNRLREVEQQRQADIQHANDLARAMGMQGAATVHLTNIHNAAAREIQRIIAELNAAIAEIATQLFGGGIFDGVRYVQEAIEAWRDGSLDAIDDIHAAQRQLYQAQLAGIQRIQDYLDSMNFGELSTLSPTEQLAAARQQLETLALAAQAGDTDAMAQLPQMADMFRRLLQGAYASGEGFVEGDAWLRELLQGVIDAGPAVEDPGPAPETGGVWDGYPGLTPDAMRERDEMLAQQEVAYRAEMAQQLVEHVAALAQAQRESALAVLDRTLEQYGGTINELVTALGGDLRNLNADTVQVIANLARDIGVPLVDMVEHLGLDLPDLADGVRELADQIGIDIPAMTTAVGGVTAAMVGQLTALAGQLNTDLNTIATTLGLELGELTDIESPIFHALEAAIGTLPEGQATALQEYLTAIAEAAGDEEKNRAVARLREAVGDLPPDLAASLVPYFEGMEYPDMTQLGHLTSISNDQSLAKQYLSWIKDDMRDSLGVLGRIADNLNAANRAADIPAFAAGGWVNGPTTLLAGEAGRELILPNHVSEFLARSGVPVNVSGGTDPQLAAEIRQMRADVQRIETAVRETGRDTVRAAEQGSREVAHAVEDSSRDIITGRSRR